PSAHAAGCRTRLVFLHPEALDQRSHAVRLDARPGEGAEREDAEFEAAAADRLRSCPQTPSVLPDWYPAPPPWARNFLPPAPPPVRMSSLPPVSSPWCPPGEVRMTPRLVRPFLALLLGLALAPPGFAQAQQPGYPEPLLGSLRYRLIGPFRGGRCAAVTGVP